MLLCVSENNKHLLNQIDIYYKLSMAKKPLDGTCRKEEGWMEESNFIEVMYNYLPELLFSIDRDSNCK